MNVSVIKHTATWAMGSTIRMRPGGPTLLSGISGTSSWFIALIIVSATFPSLIRNLLAVLHPNWIIFNNKYFWVTLLVDFLVIILPVELMITVMNNQSPYFFIITCCIILIVIGGALRKPHIQHAMKTTQLLSLPMIKSPFISYFRAYTNIFTGFSILAVDFPIYPTYFMKSRVYGTALMDSGLGFYCISNAIVSPEARGVVSTERFSVTLRKACKDTIPLIFMGFARFYVTGMADYHVPVQEYGVHWNFFFTLAVVKMCSTILFCVTPLRLRCLLGPTIILGYQYLLATTKLRSFILWGYDGKSAKREDILESNREGILASVGFLAIYFIGVQLGTILMKKRRTIGEYVHATTLMTLICGGSYIMMYVTGQTIELPSRKFANLSYTFFVIGVTSLLMVQGLVFDIIITQFKHLAVLSLPATDAHALAQSDMTCPLLQGINFNGLLFFAVANLMTGLVNLLIDTTTFSAPASFIIVNIYMFILAGLFLHLYRRKFVFKNFLWGVKRTSAKATVLPTKGNISHLVQ